VARPRKEVKWWWNGKSLVMVRDGFKPVSVGERELVGWFEQHRRGSTTVSIYKVEAETSENEG
jgi:hypothetical protein